MSDKLIETLILGAPNLLVALFTLFWCFRAIERKDAALEARTQALLAALLELKGLTAQLNGSAKSEK